jgi:putative FmdB family regulatory protein
MPTYEYVCEKCGHRFDVFRSMKDAPLRVCPKELCGMSRWGKGRVAKQLGTGAGLLFKGSGFYITDYRSEKYREAAKKDTAPAAAGSTGAAKSSSSSDSKPSAPKSDSKPAKAAP